ncbi:MAG: hypothetical protein EBZ77_08965, partial [Chitinophagia bacterium]|nr:hypothetical protein [Chitinophagia bacterium]
KTIGPVPRQHMKKIWEQFIAARKHFFQRKDANRTQVLQNREFMKGARMQQMQEMVYKTQDEINAEQERLVDLQNALQNVTPGKKAAELTSHLTVLIGDSQSRIKRLIEKMEAGKDELQSLIDKERADRERAEQNAARNPAAGNDRNNKDRKKGNQGRNSEAAPQADEAAETAATDAAIAAMEAEQLMETEETASTVAEAPSVSTADMNEAPTAIEVSDASPTEAIEPVATTIDTPAEATAEVIEATTAAEETVAPVEATAETPIAAETVTATDEASAPVEATTDAQAPTDAMPEEGTASEA